MSHFYNISKDIFHSKTIVNMRERGGEREMVFNTKQT